jgi:hypothetical protein
MKRKPLVLFLICCLGQGWGAPLLAQGDPHLALETAQALAREGREAQASAIYRELWEDPQSASPVQVAAGKGLFALSDDPVRFLRELLGSAPPELRRDLIKLAYELPADFVEGAAFLDIEGLTEADRTQLVRIFARRGDTSVRPFIHARIQDEDPDTRTAGLEAIVPLAAAPDVNILLSVLGNTTDRDHERLTREALVRSPDPGVDDLMREKLPYVPEPLQIDIIAVIRERATPGAEGLLMDLAKTGSPEVREEW